VAKAHRNIERELRDPTLIRLYDAICALYLVQKLVRYQCYLMLVSQLFCKQTWIFQNHPPFCASIKASCPSFCRLNWNINHFIWFVCVWVMVIFTQYLLYGLQLNLILIFTDISLFYYIQLHKCKIMCLLHINTDINIVNILKIF